MTALLSRPMVGESHRREHIVLCTKDPVTGDYLVVDGDDVIRVRTRAEALVIAHERCEASEHDSDGDDADQRATGRTGSIPKS
jgi:hypothetical protein